MTLRIPYTQPSITELEVRYATDAAANDWGARCYDYNPPLQKADLGWQLEQELGLPVDLVVIDQQEPRTAFQRLVLAHARDILPAGSDGR